MSLNLLATQLELFHAIFDKSCDAVVVVDEKGNVRHWSPAAETLFGFTAVETVNKRFDELLISPRSREIAHAEFQVFSETGRSPYVGKVFETKLVNKSGAEIWVDVNLTDIRVDKNKWIFAIIRDVDSRKTREAVLKAAAKTDPLSGLANRSEFQIQLEKHLPQGLALAFIDVDELKQINDQHGHKIGDDAILHVSSILKSTFPRAMCIARLGGDEFGLIDDASRKDLEERFKKLLTEVSSIEYSDGDLKLTISIGVSQTRGNSTARSLLTSADKAMYRSKHAGGNCVTFNDDPV